MTTSPPSAVRHTKKTEWGIGLLLSHDGSHFRYRFEDGEERLFALQSLSFLSAIEMSDEERAAVEKKTRSSIAKKAAATAQAAADAKSAKAKAAAEKVTFEMPKLVSRQLEVFLEQFPGGFAGEKFIEEERGPSTSKRRAFKQASITAAQGQLSADELRNSLINHAGEGTLARCRKVLLKAKNFLDIDDISAFADVAGQGLNEQRVAETLFDLLFGTGDEVKRFEAFAKALPGRVSTWPVSSIFGALVLPEKHIFIDPQVAFTQAEIVGVKVKPESKPGGALYGQLLGAAQKLKKELEAAGQKPRDMMDVYSFEVVTLLPPEDRVKS